MMRIIGMATVLIVVGGMWPAVASAQSLGEIARKEEERRKAIKAPGKVYTAADLKRFGGGVAPVPEPAAATVPPAGGGDPARAGESAQAAGEAGEAAGAAAANPAAAPQGAQAAAAAGETAEAERDQAWWRQKFADTRNRLEIARATLRALKAQYEILGMAMTEDPAERARLDRERARVGAESDRLQAEVNTLTSALSSLEAEARRANVPPGWIR